MTTQTFPLTASAATPHPKRPSLRQCLVLWHRNAATRRQLAALEDSALADLGLTRTAARAEAAKWFWQV